MSIDPSGKSEPKQAENQGQQAPAIFELGGPAGDRSDVLFTRDTPAHRAELGMPPMKANVKAKLLGTSSFESAVEWPAELGVLWYVVLSELIVVGAWVLAGWGAGLAIETMAILVLVLFLKSDGTRRRRAS